MVVENGRSMQAEDDASKEAEHAARIERGWSQPPEKQPNIMAIGGLHRARRVVGGRHGLLNETGEAVERSRIRRRFAAC